MIIYVVTETDATTIESPQILGSTMSLSVAILMAERWIMQSGGQFHYFHDEIQRIWRWTHPASIVNVHETTLIMSH